MDIFIRLLCFCAFLTLPVAAQAQQAEPAPLYHPLDALTDDELKLAARLLREAGATDDATLFSALTLLEPPKDIVRSWNEDEEAPARQALAIFQRQGKVSEARVDLDEEKIISVVGKARRASDCS
jgi:primary-amine oxidase